MTRPHFMKSPGNIFLVGPMGAGKSTTGRQLAKALCKRFHDCDREIESSTGADIPLIFELEGEEGFRKRERAMLARLVQKHGIVLATGGGAVLDEESRRLLIKHGFIIYLHAPLEFLVLRTARDKHRPLLDTGDPRAKMEAIMREREPLYRQVADMVVTTDKRSVRYVVREILGRLDDL